MTEITNPKHIEFCFGRREHAHLTRRRMQLHADHVVDEVADRFADHVDDHLADHVADYRVNRNHNHLSKSFPSCPPQKPLVALCKKVSHRVYRNHYLSFVKNVPTESRSHYLSFVKKFSPRLY